MKIKPGIGVGEIRYGILETELIELLGQPDSISNEEYLKGTGDWHKIYTYKESNISFTFDSEDEYRLGTITIFGPNYTLFEEEVFGTEKMEMIALLKETTGSEGVWEDHAYEESPTHACLDHDETALMIWFDLNRVTEVQCSYRFESDNETIIWPQRPNQSGDDNSE